MAMNYQNFASLGVNLNRQKYGPLDISNVFTSAADLKYYLTKGTFTEGVSTYWYKNANEKIVPYPYEGQVLATVIDGDVKVYVLQLDAEGAFEAKAIEPEVDGKTIKLTDGKLELVGLPTEVSGKTYVPSLVNGVLTWAEPDTSTAEGQQQAIDGLAARATALELTVNGKPESEEGKGDAVVGLVDKVAALEAVDNATQAEFDAYKQEVTTAISEALQAAKDYADANDADTIYDDTALSELANKNKLDIQALDRAVEDNKSELQGAINTTNSNLTTLSGKVDTEAEKLATLRAEFDALDYATPASVESALADAKSYVDGEVDKVEELIGTMNHFTTKIVSSVDEVTEYGVLYLIKVANVTGVDKYNEYILVDGAATLIGDTTTDLSNYYTKSEVNSLDYELHTRISDHEANTEAHVNALNTVIQSITNTLTAHDERITANKNNSLATVDFESFKTENTAAIATAKQEAITAVEQKGYAVATEVEATYATKAELEAHAETAEETFATKAALETHASDVANELLAYAKSADVAAELAKKIETGSIAHATDEVAEGVTVSGTNLAIVVDAFTKAETRKYVADTITSFTGGESAKDVLLALNNHIAAYEEKVGQIDAKNSEQDSDIAAAMAKAVEGVTAAGKVASDLAALDARVVSNTNEIASVKGTITTVNETLSGKISALEAKDTELAGLISGLDTTVKGHTTTITEHGTKLTALENKDIELAALIQANTDKFAGYYTSAQVDTKVQEAIDAIPDVDFTPYAKTADVNAALDLKANASDVYTKDEADLAFMTEGEVDARINALIAAADPEGDGKIITNIENLVEYVENNAGEIAALITTVGNHTTAIAKNTEDIGKINDAIAAIVQPKASEEVTVAADGTLGLGKVSTDKLEMGENTLVIDGGSATN